MNIILCGLPACGKTTIGNRIKTSDWNFIDIDRSIEAAYTANASCREICLKEGEAFFRELERQQIRALKGSTHSIIAIGGGSLVDQENQKILREIGQLIYLKASTAILWKRIQLRAIPAYLDPKDPENAFYAVAEQRIPIFEAMAQHTIDTDHLSEQEISRQIIGIFNTQTPQKMGFWQRESSRG